MKDILVLITLLPIYTFLLYYRGLIKQFLIFDRVEELKPWGRLLSDDGSPTTRQKLTLRK